MPSVVATGLSLIRRIPRTRPWCGRSGNSTMGTPKTGASCQEYLIAEWGYDKWPGLCHIIPNAGVCALALLYGAGSFARTVEIATMCGWDTDCNAGNVGTIAGVLYGLEALPLHYRQPINDSIVLSGLPGSLNILDIPTFSRRIAVAGYALAGAPVPESLAEPLSRGDGERGIFFDFALPGSTHGMRVSDPTRFAVCHRAGGGAGRDDVEGGAAGGGDTWSGGSERGNTERNDAQHSDARRNNALEFRFERLTREENGKCFFKPSTADSISTTSGTAPFFPSRGPPAGRDRVQPGNAGRARASA